MFVSPSSTRFRKITTRYFSWDLVNSRQPPGRGARMGGRDLPLSVPVHLRRWPFSSFDRQSTWRITMGMSWMRLLPVTARQRCGGHDDAACLWETIAPTSMHPANTFTTAPSHRRATSSAGLKFSKLHCRCCRYTEAGSRVACQFYSRFGCLRSVRPIHFGQALAMDHDRHRGLHSNCNSRWVFSQSLRYIPRLGRGGPGHVWCGPKGPRHRRQPCLRDADAENEEAEEFVDQNVDFDESMAPEQDADLAIERKMLV